MNAITSFFSNLSTKQWLIIIGIIIALIIIIVLIRRSKKPTTTTTTTIVPDVNNSNTDSQFPLSYGARGENVKLLQSRLNERYKAGLIVDGIWGPLTDAAVKKYLNVSVITSQTYLTV